MCWLHLVLMDILRSYPSEGKRLVDNFSDSILNSMQWWVSSLTPHKTQYRSLTRQKQHATQSDTFSACYQTRPPYCSHTLIWPAVIWYSGPAAMTTCQPLWGAVTDHSMTLKCHCWLGYIVGKYRPWNDLLCVGCDIKPFSHLLAENCF